MTIKTTVNKLLNSIAINNNIVQHTLDNDNEVIQCACVRSGHLKSNYQYWVQNSKPCVRKLIAETYPEYIPLLPCETDWELNQVQNHLLEYFKPKLDVLEKFLAKIKSSQNHDTGIIALQLKHETLTREMTAIEKTMSLTQLWQIDSPFWTEKLSGNEIVDVLYAYSWSDKPRNEFDFKSAYNFAKNPLYQRLNKHMPFVDINKEILKEKLNCDKCLTPLIC